MQSLIHWFRQGLQIPAELWPLHRSRQFVDDVPFAFAADLAEPHPVVPATHPKGPVGGRPQVRRRAFCMRVLSKLLDAERLKAAFATQSVGTSLKAKKSVLQPGSRLSSLMIGFCVFLANLWVQRKSPATTTNPIISSSVTNTGFSFKELTSS